MCRRLIRGVGWENTPLCFQRENPLGGAKKKNRAIVALAIKNRRRPKQNLQAGEILRGTTEGEGKEVQKRFHGQPRRKGGRQWRQEKGKREHSGLEGRGPDGKPARVGGENVFNEILDRIGWGVEKDEKREASGTGNMHQGNYPKERKLRVRPRSQMGGPAKSIGDHTRVLDAGEVSTPGIEGAVLQSRKKR